MAIAMREAPGRRSRYIVDFALDLQRKGFLRFFEDAWRRYGDLARFDIGPGTIFTVVHPDHVQQVSMTHKEKYDKGRSYDMVRQLLLGDGLVTSTGALWRRQRKLMAPFFTPRGVEKYYALIVEDGEWFRARWNELARRGQRVEMIDEMMVLTASIILKTMFSMEADKDIAAIKDAVETMIQFVALRGNQPFHLPLWVKVGKNRAYWQARERVHRYINGVIAHRRAIPQDQWPDDLLSRLMLARDDETGETMSDDLLRDESITIFFAGHETTARTLTFLWYALAREPEVEARLHAEIDHVVGGGPPTLDQLKQLPYTLQVIKETLRLYPPAPVYVRDAVADDVIDGVKIPAGARMMVFPYLTHRHPDFWPNPERFDPDRWTPDQEKARHPMAYHPFAAGQRICIGNTFSLFETHVLVAMLASRFAPRLVPGHTPKLVMAGTLNSKNGVPMVITRR